MPALKDPRVREYIGQVSGEAGIQVAKLLDELGEATDTDIAGRLGEKPSHVRKILYDLYEARIAEYYQKKDKETGWQTFHWKLTPENALRTLEQSRRRQLGELEARLRAEEEGQSFVCKKHPRARLGFGEASEANFKCPECGGVLEAEDKRPVLQQIREQIDELKRALAA